VSEAYRDYGFHHAGPSHMHARFMPVIHEFAGAVGPGTRVLDVGCGSGYTCGAFQKLGCQVVGVDLSESGVATARLAYPECRFELASATDDFLVRLNEPPFDLVVSTEVVEHLYDPRAYARSCFRALKPGGKFICTTPYHGYLKNLLIALSGKWDSHADPLWDGGHIKMWSRHTLGRLLSETGFVDVRFRGAGRAPGLWMTMVMAGTRPAARP
jgi:SAM-dependent methyltransferase